MLINQPAGAAGGGAMEPLGTVGEVVEGLGRFNVAGDGSGPRGMGNAAGMSVLYGPGFIVELPGDGDPKSDVMQVMVTITDEDFAWPVLSRMCKDRKWKMMDPDSGRTFG